MARIRTVKPEFWQDEDLSEISEASLLLAIGLLNHADDEGYFKAHHGLIKAAVFPIREPSLSIHGMLEELSSVGYIRIFEGSNGKKLGVVNNFLKHQRISRPTPSKFKEFDTGNNDLKGLTESSVSPHERLRTGKERKGKEQGKEGSTASDDAEKKEFYLTKKKKKLTGGQLEAFMQFWLVFDYKRGKAEAADAWIDLKVQKSSLNQILKSAKIEAENRQSLIDNGTTPKMAEGWLSGRRWEDEVVASVVSEKNNPADYIVPADWKRRGFNVGAKQNENEKYIDFRCRVERLEAEQGAQH